LAAGTPCFCGSFGYDNVDVAGCQAHHTEFGSGTFQGASGSYSHATVAPYCTARTSGSDYWWNTDFDSPTDCRSGYNCVCLDTGICALNQHVSGGACTACGAGKVRAAGDDPAGGDTAC
jgi:hypothetical protein